METADIFVMYGLIPVLALLVCRRWSMARSRANERTRRGGEVMGLVALVRERHLALCHGLVVRPESVPARLYETSAVATAEIRRLADIARERLAAASAMAMRDAAVAERSLRDATRATLSAERLLEARDAHLKDKALEMRCILRRHLASAMQAQAYLSNEVQRNLRNGCKLAVESAGLHLLGAALRAVRPLIIKDAEKAESMLRQHVTRMRELSRAAARKVAYTKRVRDVSAVFPAVVARTRSTVFSVMRMRLDLDPRVDRETGKVIRGCEELLRQAEALMAKAEKRVVSGGRGLDDAAKDALRAVLMANAIEARVIVAMEATTVKTAEGQPLSRPMILH